MSSYSLKFHRLTIAINTSANGAACHQALRVRVGDEAVAGARMTVDMFLFCGLFPGEEGVAPSGRYEFIPLADHVFVLVHHGVPAGNAAHAFLVAAAVAQRAGLGDDVALRALD